jgi:hypothetical protein
MSLRMRRLSQQRLRKRRVGLRFGFRQLQTRQQ